MNFAVVGWQCTVLGLEIQRWDGVQYVSSKEHLDHNNRLAKLDGAEGRSGYG